MNTDRNLLFGALALKAGLIDSARFAEACVVWTSNKEVALPDLLVERGWLSPSDRRLLEGMLIPKRTEHADDAETRPTQPGGELTRVLAVLADSRIDRSVAGLPSVPDEDLLISSAGAEATWGRYTRTALHAKGGIGQVWRAHDRQLGRDIALKELQPEQAKDRDHSDRFLAEAQITGQLEHPGIVPVYELVQPTDGSTPFYTMRFVQGRTLSEAVSNYHQKRARGQGDPVALRELLQAFVTVCNTLAYAHARGVIHRDLKGANIILGPFGEVLVLDWGLAKRLGDPVGRTSAGVDLSAAAGPETVPAQIMGTPSYMAPEQAQGRSDLIDVRSDVYGLGAVLHEILTNRPPHEGANLFEVIKRARAGKVAPLRPRAAWVPRPLEAVCLKALARERDNRYPSARELGEEAQRWLAGEPVKAWPEPWHARMRRWLGRHRILVTGMAAALLAVAVSLGIATILLLEANEKEREARNQEQVQRLLKEEQLRYSEALLYNSTIREAALHWRDGDYVAMRAALDECRPDRRGPEFAYLVRQAAQTLQLVGKHSQSVTSLVLTSDGQRLISGSVDHSIKVWDLRAGKEVRALVGHAFAVKCLALSSDDKRLYSGSGDGLIQVWDLDEGKETLTLRGHTNSVNSLALSPDGKALYSGSSDATIKVWDLEEGKETLTLNGHANHVHALALSPDGKRLYSGSWDTTIKAWDLEAGKETLTLRGHTSVIETLALSPDGKRLLSGSGDGDGTIKVWDLATGKAVLSLQGHTGFVKCLALSANGAGLFSGSWDQTIKAWNLDAGKETLTLRGHMGWVNCLTLSPDGKRLFSGGGDGTIKVWELAVDKKALTLRGRTGLISGIAASPDGKRLFSAEFGESAIKMWDFDAGREGAPLLGHTGWVRSLAMSMDGKRLFSGSLDRTIKVWDVAVAKEAITLHGHTGSVASLAVSPDGKRLYSGSGDAGPGEIKAWNLDTGEDTLTLLGHSGPVSSLALSADGKRLYSGSGDAKSGEIKAWNLEEGKEAFTLSGHTGLVSGLALSPDGKRLYSGSWDNTLKVWDLDAGKETLTLRGHTNYVHSISLSPDGKRLYSGSFDKTIKLWDLEAGKEALTLRGHTRQVRSLALCSDGKRLFSGSWDKTIKVWNFADE